jgi:hypothetical protein
MTESERKAIEDGKGVLKNGRYFNTGQTYNSNGTLRYDFDATNGHNPSFNGDVFLGYEDDVPVYGPKP